MAKPFIKINGTDYPQPSYGVTFGGFQQVQSDTNANGEYIAQKIGRRRSSIQGLVWNMLTYTQWYNIRQALENHFAEVTYWDDYEDAEVTREFYFTQSSAMPITFEDDVNVLKPTFYRECRFDLIDMGRDNV